MQHPTTSAIDWIELTKALSEPFRDSDIKYRAGAINRDRTKAQALPYADPRVYEDRLNALVPGAWQVEFEPWGETRIICRLTIHGVTRSSTGESGDGPDAIAGTSAEAQAFKRAASKFGLGRFLYAAEPHWMPYDAEKKQLTLEHRPRKPVPVKPQDRTPDGIGSDRAAAMHQALRGLGLPLREHESFASGVLKRRVKVLLELSEVEARRVWTAAQNRRTGAQGTTRTRAA